MVALWAVLLAIAGPSGPPDLVVTAAPPMNVERLADALRAYLVDYAIRVDTVSAGPGGDLRWQLDEVRRTGEAADRRLRQVPSRPVSLECMPLLTGGQSESRPRSPASARHRYCGIVIDEWSIVPRFRAKVIFRAGLKESQRAPWFRAGGLATPGAVLEGGGS